MARPNSVSARFAIMAEDAVADKAIAHTRTHGDLLQPLGQGKAGRSDLGRRLVGHHDLQQPHDVGR